MKKILAIVCACILVSASLSACSSRDKGAGSSSAASSTTESSAASQLPEGAPSAAERPSLPQAAQNNQTIDQEAIELVQFVEPGPGDTVAVVTTSMGEVRIKLFPKYAPKAVENFTKLAEEGFYNGKEFHNIMPDYLIQSGAVNTNGTGSKSVITNSQGEAAPFEDEFSMDLWHFRGAVACANPGTPNSNGSQFIVIQANSIVGYTSNDLKEAQWPEKVIAKYEEVGGAPHLDWNHTIFGMVTSGMEVVDEIAATKSEEASAPAKPVVIESVTIETL